MTEQPLQAAPLTGTLAPVAGGWDGVVVSFSEGCDDDTFNLIFGELISRQYSLRITRKGGERADGSIASTIEEDARMVGTGRTVEAGWFRVHFLRLDEETGAPVGDEYAIEFDDVLAIHIY